MADVPGLIEGAADGAGLGVQFLKHLSRTRLLLHLVDMGPLGDPVADAAAIVTELERFSPDLAARERWLVLNKTDLLPDAERESRCSEVVAALRWQGPVFEISALTGDGTDRLVQTTMDFIETHAVVEDGAKAG